MTSKSPRAPSPSAPPAEPPAPRRRAAQHAHRPAARTAAPRIAMRRSPVHGNGVFALQALKAGEMLIEYTGEVISWEEALRRHPHDPAQPNHTFYFHIDDEHVIDGAVHGNEAKWINHACDPNCEADERDGRVFIRALRDIAAGEELNYDYGLVIDEPHTPELLADFPCWCGSPACRGTLLAPADTHEPPGREGKNKNRKKEKKAREKAERKAKKERKADKADKAERKTERKARKAEKQAEKEARRAAD